MQDIMVRAPGEGKWLAIGPTRTAVMMSSEQTDGHYSLVEHVLPPQFSGPPPHVHRHYDHAWYIVEGEVNLTFGERIMQAKAGTFVFVPKGVAHTFSNPGAAGARMLEIDTPGGFENYFKELAAAFPEGASITPWVVVAIQQKYDTYPPTARQWASVY
jgi:mannose-6-phosphate isomerase-like protein (cupin superfamily)